MPFNLSGDIKPRGVCVYIRVYDTRLLFLYGRNDV